LSHTLLTSKIYTTFKEVQMMLKISFDISTGFRFLKISVECSVHSCSCPCLISEKKIALAQTSKKRCQITILSDAQDSDLAPIFGDLSKSVNISEIKPPLEEKIILLL
jgi:hypothetical protein